MDADAKVPEKGRQRRIPEYQNKPFHDEILLDHRRSNWDTRATDSWTETQLMLRSDRTQSLNESR